MIINSLLKKNTYKDSVSLMNLSRHLSSLEGIENVHVLMGTEHNKEVLAGAAKILSPDLLKATPNDLMIVAAAKNKNAAITATDYIENWLTEGGSNQIGQEQYGQQKFYTRFEEALQSTEASDIAFISVPGEYAYWETCKALKKI